MHNKNNYNLVIRDSFTIEEMEEFLQNLLHPENPSVAFKLFWDDIDKVKNEEQLTRYEAEHLYIQMINTADIANKLANKILDYGNLSTDIGNKVLKLMRQK